MKTPKVITVESQITDKETSLRRKGTDENSVRNTV